MTGKEIVKDILALRKWSQSKLAEEMGKSQTNITGYLNRGKNEMRLDVFVEMIGAMGCEVIVQDKMGSSKKWKVKYKENEKKVNLDILLSDVEKPDEPTSVPIDETKKTKGRIKLT